MPRLRLATLWRQSRDSACRFSRRICACATAVAARLRLSENSLRSFKPLRGFTGALAFRALAPACLRRHGAARGSLALPPVSAPPRSACARMAALLSFVQIFRFLCARRAGRRPCAGAFLLAGARRFAFSARAASRSQTKREFCIIEGSLTGFRPSATPSISEYSKNRAHIVRSGRAIFLRCLQNLRFVWLRLGFGFCAVRLGLSWCCASFRLLPFFLVWFMPPPRPRATAAGAPFRF